MRGERNVVANKMKGRLEPSVRQALVEEGKNLKEALSALEEDLVVLTDKLQLEAQCIPNITHPDVPIGGEENSILRHTVGNPPEFKFTAKDHIQLGKELDLFDFDSAAEVSGAKFYYLKNEAVLLEMALINWALSEVSRRGFTPLITPEIVRSSVVEKCGFQPRGDNTQMANTKDVNVSATWDRDVKMIFCELCLKEVELGNRPTTHFNKEGWLNIIIDFKARTGRDYNKIQLKNKWDQVKKDWKLWKELKRGSTGLGWDPIRRTIDASDEWWTEKLQVVPNARKFRFSGIDPEMESMLDRMFVGIVATGEHVWATSANNPPIVNETENSQTNEINNEEAEVNIEPEGSQPNPSRHPSKRSKVGAGFLREQISQLVSTCSSWTSTPATTATRKSSMAEALKLLDSMPEVFDDIPFYIACVKLLKDPSKREVFSLLIPSRRLPYLRSYF